MARIAGINLPNGKHVWIALTSIYGIGRSRAIKICADSGVDKTRKVKDLSLIHISEPTRPERIG